MTPRRAALSLVALAAVSTLSGCGDLHPGTAVVAGDDRISLNRVDELTRDVCEVIQHDPQQRGTYPMSLLRQGVVRSVTLRTLAAQLAGKYDVTPGSAFNSQVKLYDANIQGVSDSVKANAIEVLTTPDYVRDILDRIGRIELGSGVADASAYAQRGEQELRDYALAAHVEFDPRFALTLDDKGINAASTDSSSAVSDFAKQAAAGQQPDDAYVKSLPAAQRCG